jgi:streptogramin lyase
MRSARKAPRVSKSRFSVVLGSVSLREGPLVIPGSLGEAEQLKAEQEDKLTNPEAVTVREESRMKFSGLGTEQASKVDGEAFSAVIDEPDGGPPRLPEGQSITGYVSANVGQVNLGGGEHGLVQTLAPMAIQGSSGGWSPVDLGLSEVGGVFVPANPLVAVRIPKRLGEGVQVPGAGISVSPVASNDASLAGSEGVVDGTTVFFANTSTDTDTVVKPSTWGFAVDTVLRSVESPQQLSFRVEMPEGASLVEAKDGSEAVEVVKEGVTIARIPAPGARDAAGSVVPVSMSVSGDVLELSVDDSSGVFQYPIEVDPEFTKGTDSGLGLERNWLYHESPSAGFNHGSIWMYRSEIADSSGQQAEVYYRTNGDSKIYELSTGSVIDPDESGIFTTEARVYLELDGSGGYENGSTIASTGNPLHEENQLCAPGGCSPGNGGEHNLVRFADALTGSHGSNRVELTKATVYIAQPKETHATVNYNTSSADVTYTLEGKEHKTPNVFYNGGWIGPNSGGIEVGSKDLGIGVSQTSLQFYDKGVGWFSPFYTKPDYSCDDIQCPAEVHEVFTYSQLKTVYEGEQLFRASATDAFEHTSSTEYGEGEHEIKIDATPPHGITLTGLPGKGEELELGEVEAHIKVEATDGEGSVVSSGIKSITLGVDGKEIGSPSGSCPRGPCTASGEWSINGAELGVGRYTLTVVATDNAGNVASKNYVLSVYHASPVAMGPGSVNPESGDFALGATDVDLSGGAGSLAVTRHYDSRNPREGEESPLGPQWTLSLGSLASLEVLPDGSVMVVGPEGLTHFSVKKGGGFEAPAGDTNLTLEYESVNKEYLLKDAAKGTTTGFTLPSGAKSWMPTISKGPVATNTVTDTYESVEAGVEYPLPEKSEPFGITSGSEGDLWYTDYETSKIGKITTSGTVTEYALPSGSDPFNIAQGPEGNLWYTDWGSSKVGKITPTGTITEYALPSGSDPVGITAGPDGNLWYADRGSRKVGKITPSGLITEYSLPGGDPNSIAEGSEGDLWYTEYETSKVGKITTSGVVTEYPLPETSEAYDIIDGPKGDLWFTDSGLYGEDSSIGKITPSGVLSEYWVPGEYGRLRDIAEGPEGDLWFTEENFGKIAKMTQSGVVTEYSPPAGNSPLGIARGPEGNIWYTEAGSSKIGMTTASGTIVEPKLELAPHASASCPAGEWEKWEKACRGLEFVYAHKTKENIGENETEWGEYKGRLEEVEFIAYNPSSKAIARTAVAKYEYDRLGRLRAEFNPEISPALKTIYGYDAEGHVTAMTSPGRESWAFTYGTIPADSNTGRLVKVARAPASAKLWKGEAPKNTEAPKLSGTAIVGIAMGVSSGVWSGEPVAYAYQWEDCNAYGEECTPILGADNANYTPVEGDVGHELVAVVTATNGGGSVVSASVASSEVQSHVTEYPVAEAYFGIAAGADGNLWLTQEYMDAISKVTPKGEATMYKLSSSFCGPNYITPGPSSENALWFTDVCNDAVGKITTSGSTSEYKVPYDSTLRQITAGPDGNLWFTEETTGKIGKITTSGTITEYELPKGSHPYGIAPGPSKESALWFTDRGSGMIGKITTSGVITEYTLLKGSAPAGIVAGGDGNLWFAEEGTSKVGKITTSGTISEYSVSGGSPYNITAGPDGNLWFTAGTSKIGRVTTAGAITEYALAAGSGPTGITVGPGNALWFAEMGTSKIGEITPPSEIQPVQPGTTIEYNVPLSGPGLPTMTESEVAKWGQKDNPEYATAIFPPDEPQSWPATSYKRASIDYLDSQARAINSASPSGGISTQEYNEANAVKRSLSADNRALAMNEGCISVSKKECKSAEVSELLDTKSAYSEGQLTDTWGPQHTVRLAVGKEKTNEEVLARNHIKYFYNEGAKEVEEKTKETYDLVTKTVDGAETTSNEEFDKRTATTSYSGQSNLGWKLREPTSVTTDPGGLNLTSTTKYEESTGNVIETQGPAASGKDAKVSPAYASQFGSKGSGAGQLNAPSGDAIDAHGNVWVTDFANNRVDEFSSSGKFVEAIGFGVVSNSENKFQICTATCVAGLEGSGEGEFSGPMSVAFHGGDLYVADYRNNRVEEFNEKGEYVSRFGSKGTGAEHFEGPVSVAVSSSGNVWVGDLHNNRVDEFSSLGKFVEAIGFGVVSNSENKFQICTATCVAGLEGSGNGEFSTLQGIVVSGTNLYVADHGNNRVEEFNEKGEYVTKFGAKGTGNGQFQGPVGVAVSPTSGNLYVTDRANNRVQEFSTSGSYITQFGSKGSGKGQFSGPEGIVVGSSGGVYVVDEGNNRVEEWVPAVNGNEGSHDAKTIYYTAKGEAETVTCREHPEWAGLPCETEPAAQPGVKGLPELPVTTITYNMWDQPEKTVETFGSGTEAKERTKKTTYDTIGRPMSSEETSSIDKELPKVTDKYNKTTGALEEQSTTVGEATKTITSKYNTLGQLETYTDAAGNTATF